MDALNTDDERDGVEVATVEAARARIRERAERVREAELERALNRLDAGRELTEREETILRDLAHGLTEELLAIPRSQLDRVAEGDVDTETARVALALFGED